jgi:hypothetical protein
MSKPLISRLLLENSNKTTDLTLGTLEKLPLPEWNRDGSVIKWRTPQKSLDVREQAREITGLGTIDGTTTRTLFRTVAKGLDEKDFVIA